MTRFGPFELDAERRQLRRDGVYVHLEPKAFELLLCLVEAAPRVVTKSELHERLWPRGVVADATLVALVKDLRSALDDRERATPLIRTVHRVGYAFESPPERSVRSHATHWLLADNRRLVIATGDNLVGRAEEAAICIDHPTVSRRHARIVVDGASARLEDLASKNGTTVAGTRLTAPLVLNDGDQVAFGDMQFTYRRTDPTPSTVTHLSVVGSPPHGN